MERDLKNKKIKILNDRLAEIKVKNDTSNNSDEVEVLEKNSMKLDEIDCLIPHQANLRISQFIQKKLKLKDDQVFNNIQKYGNTTGASIPIAMSEAIQNNFIKTGDIVCLAAFGAGFTWGATLLKY